MKQFTFRCCSIELLVWRICLNFRTWWKRAVAKLRATKLAGSFPQALWRGVAVLGNPHICAESAGLSSLRQGYSYYYWFAYMGSVLVMAMATAIGSLAWSHALPQSHIRLKSGAPSIRFLMHWGWVGAGEQSELPLLYFAH